METVSARAQRLWDRKLGVIEVEGATEDQLTTLYSNLYRLSLYPNSGHENTGSASRPRYEHAVQSTDSSDPPASAPVRPGKVYVNNGFWDTYRTAWSAYSLFDAGTAGELVDGFVQQYRDGGWISRWSSPGYANLMTGTSSDVSFADAHVKGIQGFDVRDAYDAAVRNATVAPAEDDPYNTQVGRKGLIESIFLGYTPSRVSEGVSWGLEGAINDFGIANMAARLADDRRSTLRRPAPLPRGGGVLPQPLAELREHVRPGDPLLPGAGVGRHVEVLRRTSTTRGSGATTTTTPRPTAGTSRSMSRTTARGWPTSTADATGWRRSSTSSSPRRRRPSSSAPTAA